MEQVGKLAIFREVVDSQSFSKAAGRLGLTHSTVSRHVKSLEESLRVRLLHRSSRTMSLTEAGSLVYEAARNVENTVESLNARLAEWRGDVQGTLKLSCLMHLGPNLVQPAVQRFLNDFPHARVQLQLDDGPLNFSQQGLDAAVRVGLRAEGRLTARKVLDNRVVLVASQDLLDRSGGLDHPSDLANYPTIAYLSGTISVFDWRYHDNNEIHSVRVQPSLTVNDGRALLEAARNGCGVAYVSEFTAREFLETGELVQVLENYELPSYAPIYLLTAPQSFPSPKVEAFKKHLLSVAADIAAQKTN